MAKNADQTNVGTGGVSVTASAANDAPGEALWHNEEVDAFTNEVTETVGDDQKNQDELFARLDTAAQQQQAEKNADSVNTGDEPAAEPVAKPAAKPAAKDAK